MKHHYNTSTCVNIFIDTNTSYDVVNKPDAKNMIPTALFINQHLSITFATQEDLAEFIDAVSELELANDTFNAEKADT